MNDNSSNKFFENLIFRLNEIDKLNSIKQAGSSIQEIWLTSDEAAVYLNVSVGQLRNYTSSGSIPYYKLGRSNRYLLSDLRSILLTRRKGGFSYAS